MKQQNKGKVKSNHRKHVILSNRDLGALVFIWLWKISPTIAIAKRHFPETKINTVYNRLLKLKRDKYIEVQYGTDGKHPVWTLTKKGLSAIKEYLPPLKEEVLRSGNKRHDLIVLAVLLGDFVFKEPENIEIVTEQSLRCFDEEYLSSWVSVNLPRRPDGYWHIDNGENSETIALEVELNRKKSSDYKDIGRAYMCTTKVHRVLWLVESLNMAKRIQFQVEDPESSYGAKHSFFILRDFYEKGWQSKIRLGDAKGKSIRNLLCANSHATPMQISEPSTKPLLLETGLTGVKSDAYKNLNSS